jgi:hypothetical protein
LKKANEALKKSLHQVKKYYSLLLQKKQKTSLLKNKSCNMPYITEDGLVEC